MKVKIVAAIGKNRELGQAGDLPAWKLGSDMERFKKLTEGSVVVMGRKTYESLPERFRPLPGRVNVVLTTDANWSRPGVVVCHKVSEVLKKYELENSLWVIGGSQIYNEFMRLAHELHITHVEGEFPADTFFPEIKSDSWSVYQEEKNIVSEKDTHATEFKKYIRR
jgi:dihydrofolate reductase